MGGYGSGRRWGGSKSTTAAFTPAGVRSLIRLLSSSARTPIICHMARPVGVSVSMASVSVRRSCAEFLEQTSEFFRTPPCGVHVFAARPTRVRENWGPNFSAITIPKPCLSGCGCGRPYASRSPHLEHF